MAKRRGELTEVDRALVMTVMFGKGILPMEKTTLDMRRALEQLPPEEARKLRRKFRKAWRKAMKETVSAADTPRAKAQREGAKKVLGVGKHVPSRQERNARKQLVFDQMWEKHVLPMLEGKAEPEKT
jgi:hypothetical protein